MGSPSDQRNDTGDDSRPSRSSSSGDALPRPGQRIRWRAEVVSLMPALRGFALSLTRDTSDADDLVQETLLKGWSHRTQFQQDTNLRAWLFTIMRNTFYSAVMSDKRHRDILARNPAIEVMSEPEQEWAIASADIHLAFQELPEQHQTALRMIATDGMSYEEASEATGCAVGTVKSRVNRARTRLLEVLKH